MPDTPIPVATPDVTPVSADDLSKDATEAEQPILKKAEESGNDATGGMGIATGIAQA
jgi:hypothetical protein